LLLCHVWLQQGIHTYTERLLLCSHKGKALFLNIIKKKHIVKPIDGEELFPLPLLVLSGQDGDTGISYSVNGGCRLLLLLQGKNNNRTIKV